MDKLLWDTYRFRRRKANATDAIRMARADIEAGKGKKYGYSELIGGMRGGASSKSGSDMLFWCERPGDYMRLVGFADEIAKLGHRGWYTHDDGDPDEILRGVVYQLPSRKGKLQFMYGYADPNNDGAARLSETIADDKDDAARWADSVAEYAAEEECDYNRAWQAGRRFDEAGEEVKTLRGECLALIRETKAACDALTNYTAIKATIRSEIASYVNQIRELREERAKLEDDYGRSPAFREG